MTSRESVAERIFVEAVEHYACDEWEAFVRQQCGDDRLLLERVNVLLRAHGESNRLLDVLRPAMSLEITSAVEQPGTQIGPYRLLERIGEGGMGVVYTAEQKEPMRRVVALKVIKPGMDTRQVVARFEAERQALAMMNHPNIAKVLDAGATEAGRPYFVMELVKGIPITEFCDRQKLDTRQRLQLFITLCQAVQHAHQKGLIHRDIKPSNVLVEMHDVTPVPKVIDFGVAKAIGQTLTETTLHTGFNQLLGTPLYMSPEQAGQSSIDVDTRSDVYSLGVLLYEILTGHTPFESETLRNAGIDEMRRMICEVDPPRPSARVSTLQANILSTVSDRRNIEPRKLSQQLRGELDWIVMKALEKDRTRRYESASALAADVQRYLRDEMIEACPPSAMYRFRKFARRHKAALSTATLVAAALLAGTGVSTWQAVEAHWARRRAEANFLIARNAVRDTVSKVAEDPRLKLADFHELRNSLLSSVMPHYEEFVKQHSDDPKLEAERAQSYLQLAILREELGENELAQSHARQSQAIFARLRQKYPTEISSRRELANSHNALGLFQWRAGHATEAEAEHREAMKIRAELCNEFPDVEDHRRDLAASRYNLGLALQSLSRLSEAETEIEAAAKLQIGLVQRHPDVPEYQALLGFIYSDLGNVLHDQEKHAEAETKHRAALAFRKIIAVPLNNNPAVRFDLSTSHLNLGNVLEDQGKLTEAEAEQRTALVLLTALADEFPLVPRYQERLALAHSNLATVLSAEGNPSEAETEHLHALKLRKKLTAKFPNATNYSIDLGTSSYFNLGNLLRNNGRFDAALDYYDLAITTLDSVRQKEPHLPNVRGYLCNAYWARALTFGKLERFAEAIADWDRALALDDNPQRLDWRWQRTCYLARVDPTRAATEADQLMRTTEAMTGVEAGECLYNAACVYSLLAAQNTDVDARKRHGAFAVECLQKARHAGFFRELQQVENMQTDSDLDSIRTRNDYHRLLEQLEGKRLDPAAPDQCSRNVVPNSPTSD